MTAVMKRISSGIGNTMVSTWACWRTLPLTRVITSSCPTSTSATGTGSPTGQKVSKLLARVHCPSPRCRSRAVTSFSGTMASITSHASSRATPRARFPTTNPISPSKSTRPAHEGVRMVSPEASREETGFRKMIGSGGTSVPSSRACSA